MRIIGALVVGLAIGFAASNAIHRESVEAWKQHAAWLLKNCEFKR